MLSWRTSSKQTLLKLNLPREASQSEEIVPLLSEVFSGHTADLGKFELNLQ